MMNMFNKKNNEIKITKEEFRKKAIEVLSNQLGDDKTNKNEDEKEFEFVIMLTGTLIISRLETKLFGKDE